jgi:hypothetical protein
MWETLCPTVRDDELGTFTFESTIYKTVPRAPTVLMTPIFGGVAVLETLDVHDRTYRKSWPGFFWMESSRR